MREMTATRRASRFAALAMAFAMASVLGGCGSMLNWDPTDLLDFLDTKKKAVGERKPVFPEGVPGVTKGVPRDMVRGSPEAVAAAESQAAASASPPPPQAAPPPAKRSRTAAKQPAAQSKSDVEIAPDDVNVEDEPPPPPPPPRRQAQKRSAQPEEIDPAQQPNPFKPRPR